MSSFCEIIHLSTVLPVSESNLNTYDYDFEEFKTSEQLQIEAQEQYEEYRIQLVESEPVNEARQHAFILLWSHNFKHF